MKQAIKYNLLLVVGLILSQLTVSQNNSSWIQYIPERIGIGVTVDDSGTVYAVGVDSNLTEVFEIKEQVTSIVYQSFDTSFSQFSIDSFSSMVISEGRLVVNKSVLPTDSLNLSNKYSEVIKIDLTLNTTSLEKHFGNQSGDVEKTDFGYVSILYPGKSGDDLVLILFDSISTLNVYQFGDTISRLYLNPNTGFSFLDSTSIFLVKDTIVNNIRYAQLLRKQNFWSLLDDWNVLIDSIYHIENITVLPDTSIILCGYEYIDSVTRHLFAARYTPNGDTIWTRSFAQPLSGNNISSEAQEVFVEDADQKQILIQARDLTNNQIFSVRIDSNGVIQESIDYRTMLGKDHIPTSSYYSKGQMYVCGYTLPDFDMFIMRTDSNLRVNSTRIQGKVFHDKFENCNFDSTDYGLFNWTLELQGGSGSVYANTDTAGDYEFIQVDTGNYNLVLYPPAGSIWELHCDTQLIMPVYVSIYDSTFNIPVSAIKQCPYMEVTIGSGHVQRCDQVEYTVQYCNYSPDTIDDAYIIVHIDSFYRFDSSSLPLSGRPTPFELRFDIDTIAPNECRDFDIYLSLDTTCTSFTGMAHCVTAVIFPDSTCDPINPLWDGSSLFVSAVCIGVDSVRFTVVNGGNSNMSRPTGTYIIEDELLIRFDSVQLNAGDSMVFTVDADSGKTYRIIQIQAEGHPGQSYPTAVVEACGAPISNFTGGYLTMFADDDRNNYLDIDCRMNNLPLQTKAGFPIGVGDTHFIQQQEQLEYLIAFQNTTGDTLRSVMITDSLSGFLNPATIRTNAASHNYNYSLTGVGIVTFELNNLEIPDVSVDSNASIGFVSFSIYPDAGLPDLTVIFNKATIIYNDSIEELSNLTFHTIGRLGLSFLQPVSIIELYNSENDFKLYPNPFEENIYLQHSLTLGSADLNIELYNLQGVSIQHWNIASSGAKHKLSLEEIPKGVYLLRIELAGQLSYTARIIKQ